MVVVTVAQREYTSCHSTVRLQMKSFTYSLLQKAKAKVGEGRGRAAGPWPARAA